MKLEVNMMSHDTVTLEELRPLVGDIDEAKLAAILNLDPSLAEIEEAAMREDGSAELQRACEGTVAQIVEILTADLEDER